MRRMVTEAPLDGGRFAFVVLMRGRAVRVDVADLLGAHPRIGERIFHRQIGTLSVGRRIGEAVGVRRRRVPHHLAVDFCAARLRALVLLEHEHARALAQHEAVAVQIERTRCMRRIVVALRQRPKQAEAGEHQRIDQRIAAAREHGIGFAPLNLLIRHAQRLRAGRARRRHGHLRSAERIARRQGARHHKR